MTDTPEKFRIKGTRVRCSKTGVSTGYGGGIIGKSPMPLSECENCDYFLGQVSDSHILCGYGTERRLQIYDDGVPRKFSPMWKVGKYEKLPDLTPEQKAKVKKDQERWEKKKRELRNKNAALLEQELLKKKNEELGGGYF